MRLRSTNSRRTPPRIRHHGWIFIALAVAAIPYGFAVVEGGADDAGAKEPPGPPGWLGLAIDDSLVPGRLVVVEVDDGGPASKAGVRLQDMVLAIDGEPTLDAERFAAAIATISPAEKVRFSIARGGAVEELTLVAAEAPPEDAPSARSAGPLTDGVAPPTASAFGRPPAGSPSPTASPPLAAAAVFSEPRPPQDPWQRSTAGERAATTEGAAASDRALASEGAAAPQRPLERALESPQERPLAADGSATFLREPGRGKTALGVRTVPVDPVSQARYSLAEPTGALVVGLVDDLPASRAGLPTGSVIVAFDRQPVRSPTELTRLVSEGPTDRTVKLEYILPGGESRAAEVSLVNVPAATVSTQIDPAASAASGFEAEIRELRSTIEALTKRLDELERRGPASR